MGARGVLRAFSSFTRSPQAIRRPICGPTAAFAGRGARQLHVQSVQRAQQAQAVEVPVGDGSVELSAANEALEVRWADGSTSTFDYQFLFDHCRCSSCFHSKTKQRLKTLNFVTPEIRPTSITAENGQVRITWPGQHESAMPVSFLRRAAYNPPLMSREEVLDQSAPSLWGSSIAGNPPTVTYDSVMPDIVGEAAAEEGVLEWLDKVHEFGFCFVTGVPTTPAATESLIRRIAFIRETLYGGFWSFTADMSKGDLAYSNQALPAHTDTAYFTDPAGLQVFHCLSHPCPPGTGGETLLVDAFWVADQVAQRDPEAYATLSRLAVPYHASGNVGSVLRPPINQPVLRHDDSGRLVTARWNNEDRCVLGEGWSPDDVREWYRAARVFNDICASKEAEYWVKLNPGTMVVIDNWRVMHGRAAFTGMRTMSGAYVGADDWRSRRRALIQQLRVENDHWLQGW